MPSKPQLANQFMNVHTKGSLKKLKKPRTFLFARKGEIRVLYIGRATGVLTIDKVNQEMKKFPFIKGNLISKQAKWMSGTVAPAKSSKDADYTFTRKKGTAAPSKETAAQIKKALKAISLSSKTVVVKGPAPEEDEQVTDEVIEDTFKDLTFDDEDEEQREEESFNEEIGEIAEVLEMTDETFEDDLSGLTTGTSQTKLEMGLTGFSELTSGVSMVRELQNKESTTVTKGLSVTEFTSETVENTSELTEKGMDLRDVGEKSIKTAKHVAKYAGKVTVGVEIGQGLYEGYESSKKIKQTRENKRVLREQIKRQRLLDELEKKISDEAPETSDKIVREMMEKFKKEAKRSGSEMDVGRKDVLDTLRLLTEIQTTVQKQSGVDLVSSGLKITGGVVCLSGVGAHVGAGLMLAGSGIKLAKLGVDKGVQRGRDKKFHREQELRQKLDLSDNPELQEALDEANEAIEAIKARRKRTASRLKGLKADALQARDELRSLRQRLQLLEEHENEISSTLFEDVLDDDKEHDDSVYDRIEQTEAAIAAQERWEERLWEKVQELRAEMDRFDQAKREIEARIAKELVPKVFTGKQKAKFQSLLDGKEVRERIIDDRQVSRTEQLKQTFSVNEDGAEERMRERRAQAVTVLLNGSIPKELRIEMIRILGIGEREWEALQELDDSKQRAALMALMKV